MSTVHFSITRVRGRSDQGLSIGVSNSDNVGTAESITSSASNQQTTLTVAQDPDFAGDDGTFGSRDCRNYIWEVANMGTDNVYVGFGSNPNVVTTAGIRKAVPAGAVRYFSATAFGEKAAVVNA